MKRNLKVVGSEPKSAPVGPFHGDTMYDKWRAEIRARDWSRVHAVADKRQPFALTHPLTKAAP